MKRLNIRYKYWFILLAALLLTACSKDSDVTGGEPVPAPTPSNPTPSVPDVTESPLRLVAATRKLTIDGVSPAGEAFDPIQFFLMSSENPESMTQSKIHKTEGEFTYDADATPLWSSNIGLKNSSNCIYGFSPASAALATIAPISEGTSYKNGAKLTLTNISPVTGSDICVIVGVKHGKSAEEAAVTTEMEHWGKFYFEKAPQNNYVSLLLDHLFAKISFSVNIDSEYHKMRSIKVKKIELLSDKTLTKVEIPLTANESRENPIGTIVYTTDEVAGDADLPSGTIYDCAADTDPNHSDGVDLPEDNSWVIPGYFAPSGAAEAAIGRHLSVRFTYDVYAYDVFDNNKKVRVREDCVSVNRLPAVTIGKEKADLKRGQSTTITLTVKPTYLYQLAEEELNNPTIVVGN